MVAFIAFAIVATRYNSAMPAWAFEKVANLNRAGILFFDTQLFF
jgi:hypothetical protein